MLRLILPFMAGVVSWAFIIEWVKFDTLFIAIVSGVVGTLSILFLMLNSNGRKPHLFGLALWPVFYILGALLIISTSDYALSDYLTEHDTNDAEVYLAKITELPLLKDNSVKVVARVTDREKSTKGDVLFYFEKDSLSRSLKYGDELVLRSSLQRVTGMNNPNEFDYSRYLRFHNILYQGYVKSDNWQLLSGGGFSMKGWFLDLRSAMIDKLRESQLGGDELAVASALILGHRSDLDKELMSAYAGAGATHVLAVSGLHVGIVYVILNFLLKFLDRRKEGRLIKTVLIVGLLFSYAALTGLSASVFRAATMFAFVAIGKSINRDTNIFNTLAASAFCLTLYEPMIVMQVGFQLSYAAVAGIVLIHPMLFQLVSFNNRLVDWIWSITCVSIAAQIATFPLALLYFHQFPNMFLLSNLVVIPAAALILYVGFSLFVFSFWKPTLLFFGFLLNHTISALNALVVQIRDLPYSIIECIDISIVETVMLYLFIGSGLYFLLQKRIAGVYACLVIGIVFTTLQIHEFVSQTRQELITVYNVKGQTVISFINGKSATILCSRKFINDEQSKLFHVRHHLWNKGVTDESWVELTDGMVNSILEWNNRSFSIINLQNPQTEGRISVDNADLDFVVLDKVDWKNMNELKALNTEEVIVSNTFGPKSKSKLNEIIKTAMFSSQEGAIIFETRKANHM